MITLNDVNGVCTYSTCVAAASAKLKSQKAVCC